MIGSFGTLAAIAVVNFKLQPVPEAERSFLLPFDTAAPTPSRRATRCWRARCSRRPGSAESRMPASPPASATGCWRCAPAASRGGAGPLRARTGRACRRGAATTTEERRLWQHIAGVHAASSCATHRRWRGGAGLRALSEVGSVMESLPGPALARAGSGVCYGYFEQRDAAAGVAAARECGDRQRDGIRAAERSRKPPSCGPAPGSDLEIMSR